MTTLMVVTAVALALAPGRAHAQGLRFSPWIGMYAPTRDFGRVQAVEFGKKKSTLSFGGDLDIGSSTLLGLRLGGAYATNSDVPFDGVGCTNCTARSNLLTMTGALVVRPLPLPGIRPYALAGAGIKYYNFNSSGSGVNALLDDQNKFTFLFGGGVLIGPDNPIGLSLEVSDYISRFDYDNTRSDRQHDLFFKVALSLLMGGQKDGS
jgi:opacity protein-like surface antigen